MAGVNLRLLFAVVSSACWSSFQHGYNTGVLNAPQEIMSDWLQNDVLNGTDMTKKSTEDPKVTSVWAVAVSIYCVGGMLGGIVTGYMADRFGRKGALLINNGLVFIAAVLQGFSKAAGSAVMLIVGRLIIGVNSGLAAGIAPMYLAEISPVSLRGSIGTVYQLVITSTILLSQVLGLSSILGTADGWPYLLGLVAIPAAIQYATLPLCPESPKFLLLNRGKELHAQRALNWLRGAVAVHGEMEEMHQEAEKNKVTKKVTLRELFSNRTLRQPLLIAMMVMIAQQLSGINVVIFFSTDIFTKAGISKDNSQYATLGVGAMNVVMTVVSLMLVECAGRKTLLLTGFVGMFISTIALFVSNIYVSFFVSWVPYLCIVVVILFVMSFAIGPGSIPWFLVTELFNQSARPAAASVAVTVNWTANFIVGLSFLPLTLALGHYTYLIFAALQALFIIFIFFKVPETKNKTVEEISAMFRQQL
ncbi:solute carrier family 2, facilitated glucose transporter member 1-like [Amyelois transitella]|uniref:solute carrier family 2, facilitated glucose transporter member 1-like n=1 Tax=Amyelois transitella TaxID=680683 RepID=UPI00298FDFBB|nr:solute carrier family 2, facilitated glucose transporter member 1-like [Amyelois transitella]